MTKTNNPLGLTLGILPALILVGDLTLSTGLPNFYQQNAVLIRPLLAVLLLGVYVFAAYRLGGLPRWALPGIGVAVMVLTVGAYDMLTRATFNPLDPDASALAGFGPALYVLLAVAMIAWGGHLASRDFGPWAILVPLPLLVLLPLSLIEPVPVLLGTIGTWAVTLFEAALLLPILVIIPIVAVTMHNADRMTRLIAIGAAATLAVAAFVEPVQLAIIQSGGIGPHTIEGTGGGGILGYNAIVAVTNTVIIVGVILLYEWLATPSAEVRTAQQA